MYLTEDQRLGLKAAAERSRRSEADLIREGVDRVIGDYGPSQCKPRTLFSKRIPAWDDLENLDRALEGFGED